MATYRPEPPVPTDIITYRLGSILVYVRPADNYEQALDFAQKEFPELASVSRNRISFNISARMNGEQKHVRISESAWVAAVTRLLRGEVIDVCLRPDSKDPPPQYLDVPQTVLHSSSAPVSRSASREPSPTPSEKIPKSWWKH